MLLFFSPLRKPVNVKRRDKLIGTSYNLPLLNPFPFFYHRAAGNTYMLNHGYGVGASPFNLSYWFRTCKHLIVGRVHATFERKKPNCKLLNKRNKKVSIFLDSGVLFNNQRSYTPNPFRVYYVYYNFYLKCQVED